MLLAGLRDHFSRLPTADLYLLNPLREVRRQGFRLPSPRALGGNTYLVGATGVLVRYGGKAELARLRQAGARSVVYVVDDDFLAAAADTGLPEHYRARLAAFAAGDWRRVKDAADRVVVPGKVLAKVYGDKAVIVPPAWPLPPATAAHFEAATRIELAHLGSGSHARDLAQIATPLADLLRRYPVARFTHFCGDAAPEPLKNHPQVEARAPLAWWRHRRMLPKLRFHLALYPLAATSFNEARSANKLFEHAVTGAASLMSPIPALRHAAGSLEGVFVEGGAEEWTARIESFLQDPAAMRSHAEAIRAHILTTDPLRQAAATWRGILAEET